MKRIVLAFVCIFLVSVSVTAIELTLEDCKAMALQTDEDMKIAVNNITQSGLDRGIAKSAYFPKFDINGGAFYLAPNPSMGSTMDIQMRGVYMAGISLTQPIYTGGKIITANKLAKVGEEAAKEQYNATKLDVLAEAEKSFWMYVAVLAKVDMIKAYITQLDSIYGFTQTAYELGLTTKLNVDRVESRRSELDYRLRQAMSGADLCRMALCRIIGAPEDEPITPTSTLNDIDRPDDFFIGIDARPELNLLHKNVEAKKLDVKMVLSDYLPTVGMQVGWNAFGNLKMTSYTMMPDGNLYPFTQSMDYRGFVGAVSVSIPVFHWGEGYRKVKKAKVEVENAGLALEKNKKLMELQAHQSFNNYIDGYELIKSAKKAFQEAENNLEAISEQYEVGLMTLTDLLEAQSQWQTAYSNLIEAKTQYKINRVEYLRNVGLLTE